MPAFHRAPSVKSLSTQNTVDIIKQFSEKIDFSFHSVTAFAVVFYNQVSALSSASCSLVRPSSNFSAPTIRILFDIWRATSAVYPGIYLLTYLLLYMQQ